MNDNILLLTDSYKTSHYKQYPPHTSEIYSYLEARGGKFEHTVFFGLQYILLRYFAQPITQQHIDEAEQVINQHMGQAMFNRQGWEYIIKQHKGYLPVEIKAVPEGSKIPIKNVLMTIRNTDPNCFWLTNYLETLLVQLWYPITVATISHFMRESILQGLIQSGDPNQIDFKLHDFGFRGASSAESAAIGGCAHLVNFKGTDTIAALMLARDYYGEDMAAFSIPAAEHSTMTAWGQENEAQAYQNMLTQFPQGMVAVVSDSYDIFNACQHIWGEQLRNKVLNYNGTVVIRPDSGDPVTVLPQLLDILGEKFGYTLNDKGYKVLDSHVRLIQGDGIEHDTLQPIIQSLLAKQWSIDNIAFGCGAGLLQKHNRDTCQFAMKCSAAMINGEAVDVYKEPVTAKWKASKKGKLKLIKSGKDYRTVTWDEPDYASQQDLVETIYHNGKIIKQYSLAEIRNQLDQTVYE